jgi:hypothetical protein
MSLTLLNNNKNLYIEILGPWWPKTYTTRLKKEGRMEKGRKTFEDAVLFLLTTP